MINNIQVHIDVLSTPGEAYSRLRHQQSHIKRPTLKRVLELKPQRLQVGGFPLHHPWDHPVPLVRDHPHLSIQGLGRILRM